MRSRKIPEPRRTTPMTLTHGGARMAISPPATRRIKTNNKRTVEPGWRIEETFAPDELPTCAGQFTTQSGFGPLYPPPPPSQAVPHGTDPPDVCQTSGDDGGLCA